MLVVIFGGVVGWIFVVCVVCAADKNFDSEISEVNFKLMDT